MCVLVEMTTRAFVSSELQNGGLHPNCSCLADGLIRKLPAALDVFWPQFGINVFGLALLVLCQSVDCAFGFAWNVSDGKRGIPKWRNGGTNQQKSNLSRRAAFCSAGEFR